MVFIKILPGSALASVEREDSLAIKHEVKSKAASFLCNSESVFSSCSCKVELPEMFRVPPAPVPNFSKAILKNTQD